MRMVDERTLLLTAAATAMGRETGKLGRLSGQFGRHIAASPATMADGRSPLAKKDLCGRDVLPGKES